MRIDTLGICAIANAACSDVVTPAESAPTQPAEPFHASSTPIAAVAYPEREVRDGGRVLILRGAAVDSAIQAEVVRDLSSVNPALRSLAGPSVATYRHLVPSRPAFDLAGQSVTEDMFGDASIGAHSTVPSLNQGSTSASISSAAQYTGSAASVDMTYGASADDNHIEVPSSPASGSDNAIWDCVEKILSLSLFDFNAHCSASGTVKVQAQMTLNAACGVHAYGSAKYQAWYFAPIPDPSGTVSSTGGGATVHFSMMKIHPSPVVSDAQVEAYNGACEDDGPVDMYQPGAGGEGAGSCPDADVFMWFHNFFDGRGLVYMGDVCMENGQITSLSRVPTSRLGHLADFNDIAPHSPPFMGGNDTTQVILALTDQLPPGTLARVIQQGELEIIAVNKRTSSEDLALSLGTLGLIRALNVSNTSIDLTASRHGRLAPGDGPQRLRQEMRRQLETLSRAGILLVPSLGYVPAIRFTVVGNARLGS